MTIEITIILLLILANGLLAMSEIAIVAARKARLQQRAERGDRGARAALELSATPSRFLSTVQVGITLVGILAGTFGGATLAKRLAERLDRIDLIAPHGEAAAIAIVVIGITYFSLVLGELVPKRIAMTKAEAIAARVGRPLRFLSRITGPVAGVLGASTDAILKLLRVRPSSEPPVSEEEITMLVEQGTAAGVFEAAEKHLVENVFGFGDQHVDELMTPRHECKWLDVNESTESMLATLRDGGHSRYPVCDGDLDNVLGTVRATDVLIASLEGRRLDLRQQLRKPLFVYEHMRALRVLELFKQSGRHLAIVIDEYGVTQGMITHHDILEAIVGDIPGGGGAEESLAVRRDDGSWLVDGMLAVDDLKETFDLPELPGEREYNTVGGFVVTQLGRIPAAADHFTFAGHRFEVVDMDGRRVDKVLVVPPRVDAAPARV